MPLFLFGGSGGSSFFAGSGFTNLPPTTGVDIQAYVWLRQIWAACRERAKAKADLAWPPCVQIWATGTVHGLTNNGDGTYTVSDPSAVGGAGYDVNRWFDFISIDPSIPQFYDLVFDDDDETKVVRTSITGNGAFTITITDDFADYLTSNFLPSVSSLVGKTYRIIRQGGLFWSERWLPWPNDQEYYNGTTLQAGALQPITALSSSSTTATATVTGHQFLTGDSVTIAGATSDNGHYNGTFPITVLDANTFRYTISGADSSPATGSPTASEPHVGAYDPAASMRPHAIKTGYELMVTANDGHLKRITLTDNDAKSLYYVRQSYEVSGWYGVVPAGKKWRNRANIKGGQPFWWYAGMTDSYYTHEPDDSVGATQMPAGTHAFPAEDFGGDCSGTATVDVFDVDVIADVTPGVSGHCNGYEHFFSPEFYKTLRGIQVWLEDNCVAFVEKKSYEGAAAIPNFVAATFFKAAGINAFTTSTTTVDGSGIGMSAVALPYTPINVYYAILDATGTPISSGVTTADTTTHLTGSFISPDDEGKTLVLSLGWTRDHPERFLYFYDKTCFIPDYLGGVTPTIYDPPTLANPGVWTTRPKSTKYMEHDFRGFVRDSNGTRTFTTNIYARYVGDNWNDPGLHTPGSEEPVVSASPIVSYEDKFFEGKRGSASPISGLSGTATDGTTSQLQDTNQNWWQGVMRTETGTADSGSTTSLSDSSKIGNAFWNSATGRWAGFVVEITQGGTVYRRPITSMSGTTLNWTDALPASANGCAYQIREPKYELNRFLGRTLTITKPDGTQVKDIPILYSDDQTLYFAAQSFTIAKGMTYQINENTTGGVWGRDGGNTKWIAPTGHDPRGADWHTNQTENLPTRRRDYGRFMKGDYVSIGLFTELYQAIAALAWVPVTSGWTSRANPSFPELNQDGPSDGSYTVGPSAGAPTHDASINGWTGTETPPQHHNGAKQIYADPASLSEADGVAPYAYASSGNGTSGGCYEYGLGRRYAYGKVTNLPVFSTDGESTVAFNIDFYAFPKCMNGNEPSSICPAKYSFDAEGDGLTLDTWHLFSTVGPVAVTSQIGGKLGSLNVPADIGVSGTDGCTIIDGYEVTNQLAIIRFNIAGGFAYQ